LNILGAYRDDIANRENIGKPMKSLSKFGTRHIPTTRLYNVFVKSDLFHTFKNILSASFLIMLVSFSSKEIKYLFVRKTD